MAGAQWELIPPWADCKVLKVLGQKEEPDLTACRYVIALSPQTLRFSSSRGQTPVFPAEMDVPFHSSGAMSRAHYAIVRKVESSISIQSADQDLFLEIKSIKVQLSHPRLQIVHPI